MVCREREHRRWRLNVELTYVLSSLHAITQVINRAGKTVTTKFQTKLLDQRNWLASSAKSLHCGGWCKVCLLFLITKENDAVLEAFAKSAFKNYSKSKEKLDLHESTDYHKKA